ncbi:MAG: YciI family protein [Anaerolineales bacterium]
MRYVLLVYQNEAAAKAATEEEMAESLAVFEAFHEEAMESGQMLKGTRLRHSDAATTVTVKQGKTLTTDGPYAETKEQLGGFYLVECADLDEAIKLAAQVPSAAGGHIEIRPVFTGPSE